MQVTRYQRFAYRLLRPWVERSLRTNEHLRLSLQQARIPIRAEVYLAYSYLNMVVWFFLAAAFLALLQVLSRAGLVNVSVRGLLILSPLPIVLALTIYFLTFLGPDLRASNRARKIDARLPYAINYMATMAAAGTTPQRIFSSLADQPVYGEVAREAAWITRDLTLLGKDLIRALSSATERSPSRRLRDFLQGAITALSSGEDLASYLEAKSHQYVQDNRLDQRRFLDALGILAESYVTVVVAAPLLLLVLLTVFVMFGTNPERMLLLGYLVTLLLLPLAQLAFALTIRSMTPEA